MVNCISLNPSLDKSLTIKGFVFWDINRVLESRVDPGSKGINVGRVIKRLGGKAKIFGFIGGYTGRQIHDLLKREGVYPELTPIRGENRTIINLFDIVTGKEIRINESGPSISGLELKDFMDKLFNSLKSGDFLIISGSIPPGVPIDIYKKIITKANRLGVKSFLDSDGEPFSMGLDAQPFLVKPNRYELGRALNREIKNVKDVIEGAREIQKKGIEVVVVSGGKKDIICLYKDSLFKISPPHVPVQSTIGAGDALSGGIAYSLALGSSLEGALRLGVAAGSAKVMMPGTKLFSNSLVKSLFKKVKVTRLNL